MDASRRSNDRQSCRLCDPVHIAIIAPTCIVGVQRRRSSNDNEIQGIRRWGTSNALVARGHHDRNDRIDPGDRSDDAGRRHGDWTGDQSTEVNAARRAVTADAHGGLIRRVTPPVRAALTEEDVGGDLIDRAAASVGHRLIQLAADDADRLAGPLGTAFAPSASALAMSDPRRTPLSRMTVQRCPTASVT